MMHGLSQVVQVRSQKSKRREHRAGRRRTGRMSCMGGYALLLPTA